MNPIGYYVRQYSFGNQPPIQSLDMWVSTGYYVRHYNIGIQPAIQSLDTGQDIVLEAGNRKVNVNQLSLNCSHLTKGR